jgi:hypothetical protein
MRRGKQNRKKQTIEERCGDRRFGDKHIMQHNFTGSHRAQWPQLRPVHVSTAG